MHLRSLTVMGVQLAADQEFIVIPVIKIKGTLIIRLYLLVFFEDDGILISCLPLTVCLALLRDSEL